jgi:hypothetical protein
MTSSKGKRGYDRKKERKAWKKEHNLWDVYNYNEICYNTEYEKIMASGSMSMVTA